MIEDVQVIGDRDAGRLQVADGSDDAVGGHVAGRVVVAAHDEDAGMVAAAGENEVVKFLEVVVVASSSR